MYDNMQMKLNFDNAVIDYFSEYRLPVLENVKKNKRKKGALWLKLCEVSIIRISCDGLRNFTCDKQ